MIGSASLHRWHIQSSQHSSHMWLIAILLILQSKHHHPPAWGNGLHVSFPTIRSPLPPDYFPWHMMSHSNYDSNLCSGIGLTFILSNRTNWTIFVPNSKEQQLCALEPKNNSNSTHGIMLGPPTICNNTDVGNSLMIVVLSDGHFLLLLTSNIHRGDQYYCLFMASPEIAQFSGITVLTFQAPPLPSALFPAWHCLLAPVDICPRTAAKFTCQLLQPVDVLEHVAPEELIWNLRTYCVSGSFSAVESEWTDYLAEIAVCALAFLLVLE